jgi:hypothetical protein
MPSGFTSREQTIARYEQLLDRPRELLLPRSVRCGPRHHHPDARRDAPDRRRPAPPDADMPINNPASQLLAKLLDLEVTANKPAWITGNR